MVRAPWFFVPDPIYPTVWQRAPTLQFHLVSAPLSTKEFKQKEFPVCDSQGKFFPTSLETCAWNRLFFSINPQSSLISVSKKSKRPSTRGSCRKSWPALLSPETPWKITLSSTWYWRLEGEERNHSLLADSWQKKGKN